MRSRQAVHNKDLYRSFCLAHKGLPLFLQPSWLDVVDSNWQVCMIQGPEGDTIGALPFSIIGKYGLSILQAPPLTPYMGPFIYSLKTLSVPARLKYIQAIHQAIIEALPPTDLLLLPLSVEHTDWLPYYWAGFGQRTLYTFRLDTTPSTDQLFAQLSGKTRTAIRRGNTHFDLRQTADIPTLYRLVKRSLNHRGVAMRYSQSLLQGIHSTLAPQGQAIQLSAIDREGKTAATILLLCDKQWMYYVLSGLDRSRDISGAIPYLIWQGILLAKAKGLGFDFEGSIYPGIHELFRGFGGEWTPYQQVFKGRNQILDWGWKAWVQRR